MPKLCRVLLFATLAPLATPCVAETWQPGPDWESRPSPFASPHARTGGRIRVFMSQYPKSLNYYLDANTANARLFSFLFETLLSFDPISVNHSPGLAREWAISEDKKTFTFRIDPRAVWSDGTPVTAHDVAWTFETLRNPANLTGPHLARLIDIESCEVLDERTVRFRSSIVHWRNLNVLAGFFILPKHAFEALKFTDINTEFPVVSGPYRLASVREGAFMRLERRTDYWGLAVQGSRYLSNFDEIDFRFFREQETAFEEFKSGNIDLFAVYMARLWVRQTSGERFDRNWIVRQRVINQQPTGFQGFAMNMRRPPFDDARVRQAMAHLLDREKMNRTLMYNEHYLHRSYYEDLYCAEHPCLNPIYDFNKDKARALLAEAGWKANPETGLLEKDGRAFVFNFLTRDDAAQRFLAIYRDDLRDVGIDLRIEQKDWAAWSKDMDEFNFSMTWAAWGASLFKDPETMWHSREANRMHGFNITGLVNDEVDRLIEAQKTEFDLARRNDIVRQIDAILTREVPYVLLWNARSTRLLYWNRFGMPPTVLGRFSNEDAATSMWWYDEDLAAELDAAMEAGLDMPASPAEVRFDVVFQFPLRTSPAL